MPSKKPRITITLDEPTAARLRRLSELTGNSQASFLSEVLGQSAEVLDRLIVTLEAAEEARQEARTEASRRLRKAQRVVESKLGVAIQEFDTATRPLFEEEERVKRRRRRRAHDEGSLRPQRGRAAASGFGIPTPLSNRGVRSGTEKAGKPISTRASANSVREKRKHGKRSFLEAKK